MGMKIRQFEARDLDEAIRIHKTYYEHIFPFPFPADRKFLEAYVVTDDNDKIIIFATLELSVEVASIGDKVIPLWKRAKALKMLQKCAQVKTRTFGFDTLYCIVHNDKWARILRKFGFKDSSGQHLFMKV